MTLMVATINELCRIKFILGNSFMPLQSQGVIQQGEHPDTQAYNK